jgi:hypothetical protein
VGVDELHEGLDLPAARGDVNHLGLVLLAADADDLAHGTIVRHGRGDVLSRTPAHCGTLPAVTLGRIPDMDVHEATNRWNDLLLQTRVLWESCRNLRQEAVSAVEVSGGTFATLGKVAAYAGVLEAGLRKAMNDVKTHRHGERPSPASGLTGEDWLKRMDERLGPEEGPDPDDPHGPKGK